MHLVSELIMITAAMYDHYYLFFVAPRGSAWIIGYVSLGNLATAS